MMWSMPRKQQKADQADEVNWKPLFEVSLAGTLKLEIPLARAAMQVSAEVSRIGKAAGQHVDRSTTENRQAWSAGPGFGRCSSEREPGGHKKNLVRDKQTSRGPGSSRAREA